MRAFKNVFGLLWLLIVGAWYLNSHSYYGEDLIFWKGALALVSVWFLVLGGVWGAQKLRQKKTLTIHPISGIVTTIILIWLTGMTMYLLMNPGVLGEPQQIWFADSTQIAIAEEGAHLVPQPEGVIQRGGIILDWSTISPFIPQEINQWFINKSVGEFAVPLAKNLLTAVGLWMFFIVLFHNVGAMISRRKEFNVMGFFQSIGLGMGVTMLVLFVLGVLGQLNSNFVWGAVGALLVLGLPKLPWFLQGIWGAHTTIDLTKLKWWIIPVATILGITLSFNILESLKPFPIGFDSLTLYQNTPNLLYQYGELISGIASYNYELLISLGQFLFESSLVGLNITILGALLAFALLFETFRSRVGWQESLLLLTVLVSMPMVSFIMHIDYKIDLALLFFSLLAIHAVVDWWKVRDKKKEGQRHLLWAGLWLGIGFGSKLTTAMLIATTFAFFAYVAWGGLAVVAIAVLALGAFGLLGYDLTFISFPESVRIILNAGLMVIGLGLGGYSVMKKGLNWEKMKPFVLVGLVVTLAYSPWLLRNGIQTGELNSRSLLYGENQFLLLDDELLGVDVSSCSSAYVYDEVTHYTGGYEGNSLLYPLVIIWESTVNTELTNNRITDIGFLLLGFAVFALFSLKEKRKEETEDPYEKIIIWLTLLYGFFWLWTSRGIIWYGMPMFIGLLLIYAKAWRREQWPAIVIGIWFVMSLFLRVGDVYQRGEALLYAGEVTDQSIYMEQILPGSEEIAEILNNQDHNVYMVANFMTYFIEKNNQRVYNDGYRLLNDFMCYFWDDDPEVTLDRLRTADFKYIVYSNASLSVEEDVNGPLHKQFEAFEIFAANFLQEEVYRSDLVLYSVPD
ncbi:MAG: hypothetical protein Q8P27_03700 [Candidatus Peregrinibacteria bacterium]|nr:hypothetical protein [Candidatus Peregrinibacteria bacterium]